MSRLVFIILVVLLFLASAYCVFRCLDTLVSMEYQVQASYIGPKLSKASEAERIAELNARQHALDRQLVLFGAGAVGAFVSAVVLLIRRRFWQEKII